MRKTILLLALLPLLMVFGCGGPDNRAEVTGTVRFNGEPLPTGTISFVPTEGNSGPSSGGIITDGKYQVPRAKGVTVGKNKVSIYSTVKSGRKITQDQYRGGKDLMDEWVQVIPSKYNVQSEIICTVQPGSNQLDFDLKGKPTGQ